MLCVSPAPQRLPLRLLVESNLPYGLFSVVAVLQHYRIVMTNVNVTKYSVDCWCLSGDNPPTIQCPPATSVTANSGQCDAVVTWQKATATDDKGIKR